MEDLDIISCNIIASSGTAKSCYIEAMQAAHEGNFDKAENLIQEAKQTYVAGHEAHAKLLQMSAEGNLKEIPLLLMHAEDQMMNCETMEIMAQQIIMLCKQNQELRKIV